MVDPVGRQVLDGDAAELEGPNLRWFDATQLGSDRQGVRRVNEVW